MSKGNAIKSPASSRGSSPKSSPWNSIIDILNGLLRSLKENFVRDFSCFKIKLSHDAFFFNLLFSACSTYG